MFRTVILESPFSGKGDTAIAKWYDAWKNSLYLEQCIRHCVARGDSPYASHKMLTKALDDAKPDERQQGIRAGFAWCAKADAVCVYIDRGVSAGMLWGIDEALKERRPVEYYSIHKPNMFMMTRESLNQLLR